MTDGGHQPRPMLGPQAHWLPQGELELLPDSIGELLRARAAAQGERTAILWPEGDGLARMTYAELLARAEKLAQWIAGRAAPGERVAVWSRNNVPFVLVEYACALAGCVLTPFNPAWTDFETRHALDLTEPSILFVGPDVRGVRLHDRAKALAGGRPVHDIAGAADLRSEAPAPLPQVSSSAPFLIQFTSGTTGRSKGAVLSQWVALNSAYLRPLLEGSTCEDVWLNPVPYSHIGGTCMVILGALSVGGAFTMLERFDAAQIARLLVQTRATRVGGVPTMWHMILESPDTPKAGLDIKVANMGGAFVPAALIRRVQQELCPQVAVAFAQSESPMVTGTDFADEPELIATSVGRPLPLVEMKIVDPDSRQTLRLNEIGEIAVRSPYMMQGYFAQPEATAQTIDAEGFLYTGDLGRMDADGVVRLHGRSRELIIRGGENVYPTEVEDALAAHPSIDAVAVIGVPDQRWGQQVAGVVKLKASQTAAPAELEAFAAQRVAHFKVPRLWAFVEDFPMTASGKIRKAELTPLFET